MAAKSGAAAMPSNRGTDKKTIAFGLVNVPVTLKPIKKPDAATAIGANMICPTHRTRIKQERHCEQCGTAVDAIKAYETGGVFVQIDEDLLDSIVTEKAAELVVEAVTPVSAIDPMYFKESYMVYPDGAGSTYDLLAAALRDSGRAAVGNTVIGRSKSTQMVVIRWSDAAGMLIAHTCLYQEAIRWDDVALVDQAAKGRPAPVKAQLDLAVQIVNAMDGPFNPAAVADTYTPALADLIARAAGGKSMPTVMPKTAPATPVDDVMGALLASVAAAKGKPVSAKPAARKTAKAKA